MKKLSIAIAVLAAAVVSAGPLTHHKNSVNRPTIPSTIQADAPAPSCPPACARTTGSQIPD